ncbi:MAG: hypothetical protein IKR68_06100 [Lachnospiraceae bacterium]|nr:hypothetical protein [Lachnospiraceae bacterium]
MKEKFLKKTALLMSMCLMISMLFSESVSACYYYDQSQVLYCNRAAGCNDDELSKAKHVVIDTRLAAAGVKKLRENENLETLTIKDLSNLSEGERSALFPYLVKGNPSLAAVLMAYEDYYDSFGNDGTRLYQKVLREYAPEIKTMRSCATVVSAALNAAGLMNYSSAATAGLVDYFEESDEWVNLGAVSENGLIIETVSGQPPVINPDITIQPGDIIFIDRKSHAQEYTSGEMEDVEYTVEEEYVYEYTGGYDATGHKNYDTVDPTGSSYEVFNPDQDGDGNVGEWESEYWRVYWERVNPDTMYVPPYDYYWVWEEEAKAREAEEKAEKERQRQEEEAARGAVRRRAVNSRIIHDHIFIWTGNEIIRQVFPDSTGNIISGSYTENYRNARSAAVSKYNFTGDFRVYRYVGPVKPYEMEVLEDEIPTPVESLKQETWKHGKEAFENKGNNSWLRIALAEMRMKQQEGIVVSSVSENQSPIDMLEFQARIQRERQKRMIKGGLENIRPSVLDNIEATRVPIVSDPELEAIVNEASERNKSNVGSEKFEQAAATGGGSN